jgi:p-methyltransferase
MSHNKRVVFVASDQPLDNDVDLRRKMSNVEKRAARQAVRFPQMDLHRMQQEVNRHLLKLPLLFKGRYLSLPDLINTLKNGRQFPDVRPDNASRYLLFANEFTLNGLYFYQFLQEAGYDPVIVQNYALANMAHILEERPLAVCISSTFLYLDDIHAMAGTIKALVPDVPVIVGGILAKKVLHAGRDLTMATREWLQTFAGRVDYFVIESHGEETLRHLLETLTEGGSPEAVPNLGLFDQDGALAFTTRREEPVRMDRSAIRWNEIPKGYLRKTLSIITSQGCHYRCRFCTYHRWFPKVHYKDLDVLRDELQRIQRLGFVRHVRFADDNFTANPKRFEAVLHMLIQENFEFTWSAFARANTITPALATLMKASGCDFINMGLESGSEAILKNMDKKLSPDRAFAAIRLLKDHDIDALGGFIVGYPGETEKTFQKTLSLIHRSGLPYYHPYLFYYSRSMLVREEEEKFGIRGVGWAWKHNTMDAVQASRRMAGMIRALPNAFTDGLQKTWETFKLLRGEGYSPEKIYRLHRLKWELQATLEEAGQDAQNPKVLAALGNFEKAIPRGHQ